ncbi:hypothetical protein [Microbacterium binotii]|uniref:hypothetical protein n=1 Tax=Microbacterium binotii TaxID=462710 RepID=UPI001F261776|nr:hypothetical protein [Microbacterium binotii]UIN31718.1 hypothetical protein LXM64_05895 [Microbacterium binotii]
MATRLFIATRGRRPKNQQRAVVQAINETVAALTVVTDEHIPSFRDTSRALSVLRDVSMRTARSI